MKNMYKKDISIVKIGLLTDLFLVTSATSTLYFLFSVIHFWSACKTSADFWNKKQEIIGTKNP